MIPYLLNPRVRFTIGDNINMLGVTTKRSASMMRFVSVGHDANALRLRDCSPPFIVTD
jgi:hypothetical protein